MGKLLKQIIGRWRRNSASPADPVSTSSAAARDIRRKQIGRRGEDAAVDALCRSGYRILERNYSCRSGEVDIIAEQDDTVVFVEVKTRSPRAWDTPESAVTTEKQARIMRAAAYYLAGFRNPSPVRYNIVAVLTDDHGVVNSVDIKANAFGTEPDTMKENV